MPAPITAGESGASVRTKINTAFTELATAQSDIAGKAASGHSHSDVVAAGASGFMTGAQATKLAGIATGATANATNAQLRDRTTHTGSQAQSTVTNLVADLAARQLLSEKGQANGYAGLDGSGKVPSAQLPSFVDDVLEYANFAAFPGTGETGKIYIAVDTGNQWRWSGSTYAAIVASPGSTDAVTEGSTNLYFTAARVRAAVLTGLTTVAAAAIAATDTVLEAFQKLQAQINEKLDADLASDVAAASVDPAENDQAIWTVTASSNAPVIGTIARLRRRLATIPTGTALGTTGTVNLDFAALVGSRWPIVATGNITFTASNYAAGREFDIRIDANGATRTLAYPASWKAYGAALPTSLASGKVLILTLRATGTTEASVDAAAALSV